VQGDDEAILNWVGTGTIATATSPVDGTYAIQSTGTSASLYYGFGTTTSLAGFSKVSFWLKSNVGTATFTFKTYSYNPTTVGSTTTQMSSSLNSGAALPINTWQYFTVSLSGLNAYTNFMGVEAAAGTSIVTIDNMRLYNDAITVDISGSLAGTTSTNGLPVYLKGASNQVKAIGYAYASSPTATAVTPLTAVLLVGDDAGTFSGSSSTSANLDFSNVKSSFKVVTNTSTLMATDTTASESLTVGVALGSASAAGNIRWYDGAVSATSPLTWVSGTTPIQGSYSY
jgi:hypothetical protein